MAKARKTTAQLSQELAALHQRAAELEGLLAAERQRAEEARRRLDATVRDSNDAVTVQDFEGRILAWNRSAAALYGYSEAEALRMNSRVLSSTDQQQEGRAIAERLQRGEAVSSFETLRVTKDGRPLHVWFTVTALVDDAGQPYAMLTTERDLTASKRMAETLEASQEELRRAYEQLQVSNEQLRTTTEALHRRIEELQTTIDVLTRQNTELTQQNAFLQGIVLSLPLGVVVLDQTLRVRTWNRSAEQLWGVWAEEAEGKRFFALEIGLPVDQLREPINACLAGPSTPQSMMLHATDRRGQAITCHVMCTPLVGAGQEKLGVLVLMEVVSVAWSPRIASRLRPP